ncbi:MAG TPA: hypothetical protein VJK02_20305 [Anaerolineales bacterium]|nr:hypothetical protein [Anaerolineales bacterium]
MSPRTTERRALDNLREQAGITQTEPEVEPLAPAPRRFPLTPRQSLLLALFLFVDVCVLGLLFLVVTNRIGLPS